MIVQGTGSAAATSVAIPAHQPGDMIFIFARGTAAVPTVPSSGGTVPTWTATVSAIANSVGLTTRYCIATSSSHTSGTWTNATHICVLVLRPNTGNTLALGTPGSAQGAANNTQTIVYPALTLQKTDGTSWGVRCGTRGVAITAVANPPTNWINRIVQPAAAGALMSVHTREGLTANPVSDSVAVTSSNSAYRAHTLEVIETGPPVPTNETIIDDFTRANAEVNVGAPNLWMPPNQFGSSNTLMINSNMLAKRDGGSQHAVSIFQLASDFDLLIDCISGMGTADVDLFTIWICAQFEYLGNTYSFCGYKFDIQDFDPTWRLRERLANETYGATLFTINGRALPAAGDTIWIKKSGTTIIVYHRPSGGVFAEVGRGTSSVFNRPGRIQIEMQGITTGDPQRWDNLRGGPLEAIPAFPENIIVDDFNRTNRTPPGSRWLGTYRANGLQVLSNQLTNVADLWDGMYWNSLPVLDCDVRATIVTVGASTEFFQFMLRHAIAEGTGYLISFNPTGVEIYHREYDVDTLIASNYTLTIAPGDEIGVSIKGSTIKAWHKSGGGTYSVVATATNSLISDKGAVAIYSNGGWVVDNFYSGGPPYIQPVVAAI